MKRAIVLILLLLLCLPSFAVDITTSVIFDGAIAEKQDFTSQITGDIWLRHRDLDNVTADIDYRFGRNLSKVNVAQIKYLAPDTDIIMGRQQIGWGVGYGFNPIDIINPKPIGSSFDPTFVRDGRDAIAVSRYFGDLSKVELIYAGWHEETKYLDGSTAVTEKFNEDFGIKIKSNVEE